MPTRNLFFTAIMLTAAGAYSQPGALNVGDQCPDFVMQKIVDYQTPTARRSDFKSPLLLLQFCTPGCKICYNTAPVLDSLQQIFPGKLSVVLVTSRTETSLEKVKTLVPLRRNYPFPYVVEDSLLFRLFPNKVTPHMVWIDSSGKVRAITGFEYVTAPNIEAVLDGKTPEWTQKKDVLTFDYSRPLMTGNETMEPSPSPTAYTAVTESLEGVTRTRRIDSANGYRRLLLINFPLIQLYHNTLSGHRGLANPKRTIWLVKDSARFFYNEAKGYEDEWQRANFFCYESRLPLGVSLKEQWEQMRVDLNRFFNLQARIEKRKVLCWILVCDKQKGFALKSSDRDTSPDAWRLQTLIGHLDLQPEFPHVINETGLPAETLLELKKGMKNKAEINQSLKGYGLKLIERVREVDFFVFAEKS